MDTFQVKPGDVILDKYKVTKILGIGGMGVVLAASHIKLGHLVALKFLHPALLDRPGIAARFDHEARIAARIRNDHVARVEDVGTVDGTPFIVMEYLSGRDLAAELRERRQLPVSEAANLVLQACEAIHEAHAVGVVHRDLKPANLFLTPGRRGTSFVKVLDFGISKSTAADDPSLTGAGVLGSPRYMSPEQLDSPSDVDARADVWALGVILYETLTGAPPFAGDDVAAIRSAIKGGKYTRPRERRLEIPSDLEKAISEALVVDRDARLPTVAAFAARLADYGMDEGRLSFARIESPSSREHAPSDPPAPTAEPTAPAIPGATEPTGPGGGTVLTDAPLAKVEPRPPRWRRATVALGLACAAGLAALAPRLATRASSDPAASTPSAQPAPAAAAAGSAVAPEEPAPVALAGAEPSAPPARVDESAPTGRAAASAAMPQASRAVTSKGAVASPCSSGATPECEAACAKGVALACNNLGTAYANGEGVARDPQRAFSLYTQACKADLARACVNLGSMHFLGNGVEKRPDIGVPFFRRGCEKGDAEGCRNLSLAYADGLGLPKDLEQAFTYAQRACSGGVPAACLQVALAKLSGSGVAKDTKGGLAELDGLCTRREPTACKDLEQLYAAGAGADVPQDPVRAGAYATKACDLGLQDECAKARLRDTTELAKSSMSQGNATLQASCDRGDARSCDLLGKNFRDKIGTNGDPAKAREMFRRACEGGYAEACKDVGEGGAP